MKSKVTIKERKTNDERIEYNVKVKGNPNCVFNMMVSALYDMTQKYDVGLKDIINHLKKLDKKNQIEKGEKNDNN